MLRFVLIVALSAIPFVAKATTVTLILSDIGVAGLESMLDIARKSAPTMREADMAISLYNALQQAKQAAMQNEQQQTSAAEKTSRDLAEENARLKAELGKIQAPK